MTLTQNTQASEINTAAILTRAQGRRHCHALSHHPRLFRI